MTFLKYSKEGPSPEMEDPWDWTVDQVVYALTNPDSPLLKSNQTLSFPDAAQFARTLYENDVTGLALLTEVQTNSLRDELNVKSMGHRASVNHLIRHLQDSSVKYQEHFIKSGRGSSFGMTSRSVTPLIGRSLGLEAGAALSALGQWQSPLAPFDQSHNSSGISEVTAPAQDHAPVPRQHVSVGVPELPSADCQTTNSQGCQHGLGISIAEDDNEKTPMGETSTHASSPTIGGDQMAANDSSIPKNGLLQSGQHVREGETTVIDEAGRQRRRLVLGLPSALEQTELDMSKHADSEARLHIQITPQRIADSKSRIESTPLDPANAGLQGIDGVAAGAPATSEHVEYHSSSSEPREKSSEPGTVFIGENGRKRMRSTLVHQLEADTETNHQNAEGYVNVPISPFGDTEALSQVKQLRCGKRAKRRKDQIYLGPEPLSVDRLFYEDILREPKLDQESPIAQYDDTDDFTIMSNTKSGGGLPLYVNNRMRYYLKSQILSLESGAHARLGIIPYPNRIGRKHYPLSMTVFSKSSQNVSVSRCNRSKWIKDVASSVHNAPGQNQARASNFIGLPLAQDDGDDPEWKALEKWKYMDAEDHILPIYGESGSEGEYELDTLKEIEQERDKMARLLQKSNSRNLPRNEVEKIVATVIEQFVEEWKIKKKPKLEQKAWRIWTEARRFGNVRRQTDHLTYRIDMLDKRIQSLQTEIIKEEWSRPSHLSKQCKIVQPSVLDREDHKWKLTTLGLEKMPKKPTPTTSKLKAARLNLDKHALEDYEGNLDPNTETSDFSEGSLDGFIVQDDYSTETHHPLDVDDDLAMAEVGNGSNSDTLVEEDKDSTILLPQRGELQANSPSQGSIQIKVDPQVSISRLPIVDLTLDSDSLEPKSERDRSFDIRTPPVITSEDEGDAFLSNRSQRPEFKKPPVLKNTTVINLESDSPEPDAIVISPTARKPSPPLSDVVGIKSMNPSELVERQDRKRLLIWIIAHTPTPRRQAASDYLTRVSYEISRSDTEKALKKLRSYNRRMSGMDKESSDCIMSIASWHVCWTIPVKTDQSGLKKSHIDTTLADEDGFEPFYDFLMECLSHCHAALDPPEDLVAPTKKRQKIRREFEDASLSNSNHKRKYVVTESQETLNKRQAAQDRVRGDEERRREEQRRRKELKSRLKNMGSDIDSSSEVVVNPGKLEDQDYIYLNPQFGQRARIKEHQKEGLQFLWREITAEHEDLQGCLLAQTMGLGKTLQVIALLVTLAEASQSPNECIKNQVPPPLRQSRTLILCPPALLENWWDEFLIWAPRPFSNNIGEVRKVSALLRPVDRISEIQAWSAKGGVLLLGYDTFKALIHNKSRTGKKSQVMRAPLTESQHEVVKEALLERANLVVADEAHTFRGRTSKINSAMNQFGTRSRIALTGSPLNNNLEEYFTLIDWIAPNYLGTYTEFKATYEEPIREGLYQDSTLSQYNQSRTKLKALEIEMGPKVHRANLSVLRTDLQGKTEFVIRLPLTKVQEDIYRIYVDSICAAVRDKETRSTSLWSWLSVLQLLCNHPKCFRAHILALKAEIKDSSGSKSPAKPQQEAPRRMDDNAGASDEDVVLLTEPGTSDAFTQIIDRSERVFREMNQHIDEPALSYKILVLMRILELANAAQDKVLIFSHRIATLDYIQEQLQKDRRSFARIDGKLQPQKRQQISKDFNEGNVNICLVSTRAGGTGLNLFGANRVVILDEHFNPMWEQQAIGRAYRIGQQKPVFVYRLTAGGTFEKAIQNQSLFKEQLGFRVVDNKNPVRSALRGVGDYFFPPIPLNQEDLSSFVGKDPLVLDDLLTNAGQ